MIIEVKINPFLWNCIRFGLFIASVVALFFGGIAASIAAFTFGHWIIGCMMLFLVVAIFFSFMYYSLEKT